LVICLFVAVYSLVSGNPFDLDSYSMVFVLQQVNVFVECVENVVTFNQLHGHDRSLIVNVIYGQLYSPLIED